MENASHPLALQCDEGRGNSLEVELRGALCEIAVDTGAETDPTYFAQPKLRSLIAHLQKIDTAMTDAADEPQGVEVI